MMESLCHSCRHVREIVSGTGSTFLLCRLSQTDKRFQKYPPQPIVRCEGHEDKPITATNYTLEILPSRFAVCRLDADAEIPAWATGEVVSITRTSDELSIVCAEGNMPQNIRTEPGWRCLRVAGPLDFAVVGLMASLTGALAEANISVFVISTFDTDLLLVKDDDLDEATRSLRAAGHKVS